MERPFVNFDPASYFLQGLHAGNDAEANRIRATQVAQQGSQFNDELAQRRHQFDTGMQQDDAHFQAQQMIRNELARQQSEQYNQQKQVIQDMAPFNRYALKQQIYGDGNYGGQTASGGSSQDTMPQNLAGQSSGGMDFAGMDGSGRGGGMNFAGMNGDQPQSDPQSMGIPDLSSVLMNSHKVNPGEHPADANLRNFIDTASPETLYALRQQFSGMAGPEIAELNRQIAEGKIDPNTLARADHAQTFAMINNHGKPSQQAIMAMHVTDAARKMAAASVAQNNKNSFTLGQTQTKFQNSQTLQGQRIDASSKQGDANRAAAKERQDAGFANKQDAANKKNPAWIKANEPEVFQSAIDAISKTTGKSDADAEAMWVARYTGSVNQARVAGDPIVTNSKLVGESLKNTSEALQTQYKLNYKDVPPTDDERNLAAVVNKPEASWFDSTAPQDWKNAKDKVEMFDNMNKALNALKAHSQGVVDRGGSVSGEGTSQKSTNPKDLQAKIHAMQNIGLSREQIRAALSVQEK